jgi:hypothetical protein
MISGIFRTAILLQATPDSMRGRVLGIEWAQVAAAPTLGDFEAGLVASLTNVRFAVTSGGVLCLAGLGVLALAIPALLRYEAPTSQREAERTG